MEIVEIIKCKDCKHWFDTGKDVGSCDRDAILREKDFFCAAGERPSDDVMPVVRCKECKHRDPEDKKCDSGALERAGCIFPVADDYFCADGERKGNDV